MRRVTHHFSYSLKYQFSSWFTEKTIPPEFFLEFVWMMFDGRWKWSFIIHFLKIPNKNYIFKIKKIQIFCDQILQTVAILDKKLKLFMFIFSILKLVSAICL